MTNSESLNELFAALSAAQAEIEGAAKTKANDHFKSKYATLSSVWDACRGPLAKNKLCVVQFPQAEGAKVTVTTTLGHASGQWMSESLTVVARDATPQSVGSAITYARRYGLSAAVGIAPDDDDGEAAQPARQQAPRRQAAPAPNGAAPAERTVAERVRAFEAKLIGEGLTQEGELMETLDAQFGEAHGPVKDWPAAIAPDVAKACREFERLARAAAKAQDGPRSDAQASQLAALVGARRMEWNVVVDQFGWKRSATLATVTARQAAEAIAWLQAMPKARETLQEA